jgi:MFS transporter, YQGE family, putative transporter
MRIEYIVVKEVFLNIGRIISITLFLLAIKFFNQEKSIPILLLIIGSGHTLIYFFIRKVKFSIA